MGKAIFLAVMLLLVPAHPAAAETPDRRIASLAAEADTQRIKGNKAEAYALARTALAIAEKTPGKNDENLFLALDALTSHVPDVDFEQQFLVFERLVPIAARARGSESYPANAALAGRHLLAFVLRKPGASLPAFADALAKTAELARGEDEQAQVTGFMMVLAQLYDATGQHEKAVSTISAAAPFYERPPLVPNRSFAPGLMSLAIRYSDWQDWPRAIDAADRAIAASVAYYGKRTVDIMPALRVRGTAFLASNRYDDAERAYREAVILSDTAPDLGAITSALLNLGRLYTATGRDAIALPLFERAAALAEKAMAQSNTRLVTLIELYNIARRSGDDASASRYARLAREDAEARGLDRGANYVTVLLAVANAAISVQDFESARGALVTIDSLIASIPTAASRQAEILHVRAQIAYANGDFTAGIAHNRAAIEILAKMTAKDPQAIAVAKWRLARGLLRVSRASEAWTAGRAAAEGLTDVLTSRAQRASYAPLDEQSVAVFDTAIETAWDARRRR